MLTPAAMHRLFVDVGYELSEHQLRQHFTKYGPVSDVYLPKHSMGRNKGYAFVTFSSEQALSKALLDPQPVVQGVKLKVSTVKASMTSLSFRTTLDVSRVYASRVVK